MPSYRFYQIDVFTDQPMGGNPLAVFPDAVGLDAETMHKIAREMNLSETTFVFPPETPGANYKVRIFMPKGEIPFAGHPVVGTQWLLAHIGRTQLTAPEVSVTFELGVGLRRARVYSENGQVTRVMMDHQQPSFGDPATPAQIAQVAQALGLPTEAITDTGLPVMWVSTGIRQLFAPIRSRREVENIDSRQVDAALLGQVCAALDPVEKANEEIMVFTTDTTSANVHSRMFAPGIGILEDPATGSASGGLAAYLIQNRVFPATLPTTRLVSEQGIEMARPSRIELEIDGDAGQISMVRVAGRVVPLIEATLSW
jgi:trans-2,3-dihydro-3-hydroxyanthranilate isomerase